MGKNYRILIEPGRFFERGLAPPPPRPLAPEDEEPDPEEPDEESQE
jgi:hypothetical protein